MTWMDLLYTVAGASAVTGLGAGVVVGVWIQSRVQRATEAPPDDQACSAVCALAALPRDRVVTIRRRPRRTSTTHTVKGPPPP